MNFFVSIFLLKILKKMGLTTDANLQIKNCAVVLERLDEKLLSKYLQKYDSDITDTSFSTSRKNPKGNISQKLKKTKKSCMKDKLTKKKRKIRSLYFSDEESGSESKEKKSLIEKTETMLENAESEAPKAGDDKIVISKTDNPRKSTENVKTKEVSLNNSSGSSPKWRESSKTEVECDKISSKNISSNSGEADNSKNTGYEIEIIQEIIKPCVSQEKINSVKGGLADTTSKNVEQNFEDEYDLREDNEDDRITIIFEGSPGKETDSEVLEIDEGEVKCPTKKLKNKEGTKLTSLQDNLETLRKPKIQTEENSRGKKVTERPELNITEYYLRKLCSLVRRLYELFRIILQLKNELPKNDEVAVHFAKVIKVQKENFFNEINKSQKTVIDCYEKLLIFYDNGSNEVISKVSQHAFLKAEDVRRIIFQCILVNEAKKKNNDKPEKQNFFQEPTISDTSGSITVNENLSKLMGRNEICKDNHITPQLHFFAPSETNLIQKPINEPVVPCIPSTRTNAAPHPQKPSDPATRSFLPSYDNNHIWNQNSSPVQVQQKNQNQVLDPRLTQSSQHVSWYSDSLMRNNQPSNTKSHISHPQNIKPTMPSSFYTNPTNDFPQLKIPNPDSSAPKPVFVHHFSLPNHIQHKPALPDSSQNNFGSIAQNTCFPVQQQNNTQRCSFIFPSNTHNRVIDAQRQALTSFRESQYPVEDLMNESARLSNQKPGKLCLNGGEILGEHCSLEMRSSRECQNTSSRVAPEVLDPTVPQKLTMKNYRLQAEPTLRQETEGKVSEAVKKLNLLQSSKEEMDGSELSTEKSNSREYICAQSSCKMPGLRICKGCQSVIYCSETCQLKHWVLKHKTECYQLRELRGV